MSEYDLDIRYLPDRQNSNPDAFSCAPLQTETSNGSLDAVQIVTVIADSEITEIIKKQRR